MIAIVRKEHQEERIEISEAFAIDEIGELEAIGCEVIIESVEITISGGFLQ